MKTGQITEKFGVMLIYWEKSGRFIEVSYRNKDGVVVREEGAIQIVMTK
ncbi:MAG: hypothetical protein GX351_05840 [Peptococcaceae bacterium]|jgi:hypothetical protein|nr:hypothetical protein [Peptococcaceae bacterium]